MKKKLSSIFLALIFALGLAIALPTANGSALAAASVSNGSMTVSGQNYSGVLIDTTEDVSVDLGTHDISSFDMNEPIIAFTPWDETVENDDATTFGYFEITLTSGDKFVKIQSFYRGDNTKNWGLAAKADGTNFGIFNWSSATYGNLGTTAVANGVAQAGQLMQFSQGGKSNGRTIAQEDGSTTAPAQKLVKIYYTNDGTLWMNTTNNHNNNGKTQVPNSSPAQYRYPLCKLGEHAGWTPFTADELKNVHIQFDIVGVNAQTKMVVTKLPSAQIIANVDHKGLINTKYELPTPSVVGTTEPTSGLTVTVANGTTPIDVKNASDAPLTDNVYEAGAYFTPTAAGIYTVTYTLPLGGDKYAIKTIDVEIAAELPPSQIVLTNDFDGKTFYMTAERDNLGNNTFGLDLQVGGKVINNNQTKPIKLKLEVKTPGADQFVEMTNDIPENFVHHIEAEGVWQVRYTAGADVLGRIPDPVVLTATVKRAYVTFTDGIANGMYYTSADAADFVRPSINDVSVYDIIEGSETVAADNTMTAVITVTKPDNTTAPIEDVDFSEEGEYVIDYAITYLSKEVLGVSLTETARRRIFIFSDITPNINVTELPSNVTLVEGSAVTDDIIKVKAVLGKTITFPYGYFSGAKNMMYSVTLPDGTALSAAEVAKFDKGEFAITPDATGKYIIAANANIGDYRAVKTVEIDVKAFWYTVSNAADRTVEVGYELKGIVPTITDFYGNIVAQDKITVAVSYNYEPLTAPFVADRIGRYVVEYSYTDTVMHENISGSYYIDAQDTEKPVIALSAAVQKANKNDFIKIADPTITDKSGLTTTLDVKIVFNGEEVTYYDNGFKADKAGKYEVIYTVVDFAGNQQIINYVIEVGKMSTGLIIGLSVGGGVLGLLIIAAAVIFILIKKGIIPNFFKKKAVAADDATADQAAADDDQAVADVAQASDEDETSSDNE